MRKALTTSKYVVFGLLIVGWANGVASAAPAEPAACPTRPTRVVMPGGNIDFIGIAAGIPQLCRMRRPDGDGDYYYGFWKTDWPGAGSALPAIKTAIEGAIGTRASFVTRSAPGLQWTDSIINGGTEILAVNGASYHTIKLSHEREGIEGNTYHSVITLWRDVDTGIVLKVVEDQISGQSYGPGTTWTASGVQSLAPH